MTIIDFLRHIDQQTFLLIYNFADNIPWLVSISYYFARYGIVVFVLIIIYIFYRPGTDEQKIRDKKAVFFLLISLALAFLADEVINLFKARYRPFVTFPNQVAKLDVIQDLTSFPSTHTIFVFAISVSLYISKYKRVAVFLFILSLLVGISRVAVGVHYPFDIIGGIVVGVIIPIYVHHERSWLRRKLFRKEMLCD